MSTKSKKIRTLFLCLGALAVTVGGMSLKAADKGAAAKKLPEIQLQAGAPKAAPAKPAVPPETVVMKINGQAIKQGQVDEMANQMIQSFMQQMGGGQMMPGGLPPELMENARNEALQRLKSRTLIEQAMKDLKKEPTEAEVKAEMAHFDAMIKSQVTTDSLANQLAEAQKKAQAQDPKANVEAQFKDEVKSIIKQIALVEKECGVKIDPTDAEVKAEYDKDPGKFKQVRASHILIATKPQQGTAVTVDKEALEKAQSVLKEVKAGKDFAQLAEKYSDDPGSKSQGGDLNFFTKDKMVKEFADAAFKMKKGEVSDLVKSQFGYHIIKVTDIKETSFDRAKTMIFMETRGEKMQKYFKEAMEKITNRAKIEDLRPKTEKAPAGAPAPAEEKKSEEKK